MLDPKDVFIVDSGAQVFVWIGKLASAAERKGGMQYAQKYLTDFGRPTYMPISRVIDGGESDGTRCGICCTPIDWIGGARSLTSR